MPEDTLGDCTHTGICPGCGAVEHEAFHYLDSETLSWDCQGCGAHVSQHLAAD